jgi:hypothetical protein
MFMLVLGLNIYMLSYSTKCFSLSSGGEFYLGNGVVCKLCGRNGSGVKWLVYRSYVEKMGYGGDTQFWLDKWIGE